MDLGAQRPLTRAFHATRAFFQQHLYASCLVALLLKWLLIADARIHYWGLPFEDALYVERAYHVLTDGTFGSYDARTLSRPPGISWLLAGTHVVGVPYLPTLHWAYGLAALFFVRAAERCSVSRPRLFVVFMVLLLSPVTFDLAWFRATREPATVVCTLLLAGALLLVYETLQRKQIPWLSCALLGLSVAATELVSGDVTASWTVIPLCVLGLLLSRRRALARFRDYGIALACVALVPSIALLAVDHSARRWIDARYGVALLDSQHEGEFPELWAELERVEPLSLSQLGTAVPRLKPALERLSHVDVGDRSALRWLLPSAAFAAGSAPTAAAAQRLYRDARIDLQRACAQQELPCRAKPSHRPSFAALAALLQPELEFEGDVKQRRVTAATSLAGARWVEAVLHPGVPLDDGTHTGWSDARAELRANIAYWLANPDVAASDVFGPARRDGGLGARAHFDRFGKSEGRRWPAGEAASAQSSSAAKASARRFSFVVFGVLDDLIQIFGVLALFVLLARGRDARQFAPVAAACTVLGVILLQWAGPIARASDFELSTATFHASHTALTAFALLLALEVRSWTIADTDRLTGEPADRTLPTAGER